MSEPSQPEHPIRVLIVDDHEVVHWGLRIVLERLPWIERSFSARSAAEALARTRRHEIDVALVDLFVGAESGPEICERLHGVRPGMRMLLISGVGQISPRAAAACGASGFISKDWRGADIVRALGMVAAGLSVFEAEPNRRRLRPSCRSESGRSSPSWPAARQTGRSPASSTSRRTR